MAMSFTPVSFCQSSYIVAIELSSCLQGEHHVAQKFTMIGLPSLEIEAVLTLLPSGVLIFTTGSDVAGAVCETAA
jgi:hypothetical protein